MRHKTKTSFKSDNQAALKHGGEAAIKAIQRGEPFTGVLAEVEQQVRSELDTVGLVEMVKRAFVRLETASTLFYNGMQDANERGDFEQMDRCTKRFGWLQMAALRAGVQLAELEANTPNTLDYEQVIANRGKQSEHS